MILILGKNGQVSGALASLLGPQAMTVGSAELDLSQPGIPSILDTVAGDKTITNLINAAAYTAVDKAESEPELAVRINGEAVGEIAAWCRGRGVQLVHYSTDYVFDGSGSAPWKESDATRPLSVYGKSKLLGERLIADSGANHLIFRTSWVYDATGKNFLNTMRRLMKEREALNVVADQWGAPTYAPQLAKATLEAINVKNAPSGIYHLCGGGETTWQGFAQAILGLASTHESGIKCQQVLPITTTDYPTPAQRPANSRLDCGKARTTFGIALPDWMVGLNECYESIRLRD